MKKILLTSLVICNALFSNAQESNNVLQKDKEFVISVGPTYTALVNTNVNNDKTKVIDNGIGMNLGCSYSRYFKNKWGLSIGLNYSDYKQTVYQNGLFILPNQVDQDGNACDLWYNSNVTEIKKSYYLDVPVMLHLIIGKSKRIYGFINGGLVTGVLVWGDYTKKGTVENMGKYPTANSYFNIVSQNNPRYQYEVFPVDVAKTYEDAFAAYNFSVRVSAGVAVSISDMLSLRVSPVFTKGIWDVTPKDLKNQDYVNVLGEKSSYKPTKASATGIDVGLGFNF